VVNISTVGTSQIIGPDGRTLEAIPAYKPGRLVRDVPLASTVTPAVGDAAGIEVFCAALGGLGLLLAGACAGMRKGRTHSDPALSEFRL
jgi:apolipoprotein N-acyltransferase